jgi:hypothetical protein
MAIFRYRTTVGRPIPLYLRDRPLSHNSGGTDGQPPQFNWRGGETRRAVSRSLPRLPVKSTATFQAPVRSVLRRCCCC